MTQERLAVVGEHFYQPPRFAAHYLLTQINVSPDNKNWTDIITDQCYVPQLERGLLKKASFDLYGSLRAELALTPEQLAQVEVAMAERGVGDPFLHPILPDLNSPDRRLLLEAGKIDFFNQAEVIPSWFWPPETALDTPTLRDISHAGYEGVICAPEQLVRRDGLPVTSSPVQIDLGSGESILAYPFDRPISQSLAFDGKKNADFFIEQFILPRLNRLPDGSNFLAWTDGETFGHHDPFGHLFLEYLLNEGLSKHGIHLVSLKQALQLLQDQNFPEAQLVERTAWSCPHGNLARWNGECGCSWGADATWKAPFMKALREVNSRLDRVLGVELPNYREELAQNFRYYFTGEFLGLEASPDDYLMMAKASSLAALTSCATFFDNVDTSGRINMLFVIQVSQSLISAGLVKPGKEIYAGFMHRMEQISDDQEGLNFAQIMEEFYKA